MKKASFEKFVPQAKKRYGIVVVLIFILALSGIGALICIVFGIGILSQYDYAVNLFLSILWLSIVFVNCSSLANYYLLFLKDELDENLRTSLTEETLTCISGKNKLCTYKTSAKNSVKNTQGEYDDCSSPCDEMNSNPPKTNNYEKI